MSETFGKDIMESIKDAVGTDIEDFIDPASIKKDLGDEMKKDLELELKAIDEDKEMNSIEKNFKKAFLKLKNSVLGGIFGWDKESKEDEKTAEPTKIENYKNVISDPALLALASGPDIDYMKDQTYQMYLLNLEEKYNLPYKLLKSVMGQESAGKLYKNGEIHGSKAGAKGLFQFIPDAAKDYIEKLGYPRSEYQKIWTDPLIAAQAAALFLGNNLKKGPSISEALAGYNRGGGNLEKWLSVNKEISAGTLNKLPPETQQYIVLIGDSMLKEINIDLKLTKKEASKPPKISKPRLEALLSALNKTPLTKDHIKHKEISPNSANILATNMTEVSGFGASLLEGLRGVGLENTADFRGENTTKLLQRLDEPGVLAKIQKGKSCILFEGYNDIASKTNFKENMKKIIEKVKPTQAILCTLYYNNDPNTPNEGVDKINKAIREIASEQNIPLIDIQKDVITGRNDGLHLTASDYKKVYDKIKQTVENQAIA